MSGADGQLPPDRSQILTERIDPRHADLHQLDPAALVQRMAEVDAEVTAAVAAAEPALIAFLTEAMPRFANGGRLIYLGAGTSGRLGVLDASECPPTFRLPPDRVIGIIAGGDSALRRSSEGAEDDPDGAIPALEALALTANDSVVGIAAGGTTPYVRGALAWAAARTPAPVTALLCCAPVAPPPGVSHLLCAPTGPELVAGSTRMKAGTATKLLCNRISTALAIGDGRVYRGLMVDLKASNVKLRDRAARILLSLDCGSDRAACLALLDAAGGAVKTALVMHRRGLERTAAEDWLAAHSGRLDELDHDGPQPA